MRRAFLPALLSLLWLLSLSSCSGGSAPVAPLPDGGQPAGAAQPSPGETSLALPSTSESAEPPALPVELTAGPLWLRIDSPLDNQTVATSPLEVRGQAPEGAVVSINDQALLVPDSQAFTARVDLEEGPNLIEIVASDADENQVETMLIANYEPEP